MKTLLTALIILLPVMANAQEKPFIFQITSYSTCDITIEYVNGEFKKEYHWDDIVKTSNSMYMALDFEEMVFSVDNNMHLKLMIRDVGRESRDKDSDGDWYRLFTYTAIDNEYNECEVNLRLYDDVNLVQLAIEYDKFAIIYHAHVFQKLSNNQTSGVYL